MPKKNDRYVTRRDNGWAVIGPNHRRPSHIFPRQRQALDRARDIVGRQGGGEVRIQDRHGRWRDSDTVPPGNDPCPPRDTR